MKGVNAYLTFLDLANCERADCRVSWFDTYGIMRYIPEEGANPPSYFLKDVLTLNGRNLTGAMNDHYTQIRSWMVEKLGVTSDRICTNREMVNIRSLTSLSRARAYVLIHSGQASERDQMWWSSWTVI